MKFLISCKFKPFEQQVQNQNVTQENGATFFLTDSFCIVSYIARPMTTNEPRTCDNGT